MPVDWAAIRAAFPALENWTYLNTATLGLMSRATRAASDRHFARREALANTDFLDWWNEVDDVRGMIARLLLCEASDIAFFPNASAALGLALRAVEWREGDELLTLTDEFPNQIYANAGLPGVTRVESPAERFLDAVTPRTRMVALSTVNYQTGLRARWEQLVPELRSRGIFTYVDGTQSFGALVSHLRGQEPDMFAVNCYKWACAPPGAAFAYVHPDLRRRLKPVSIGWRSDAGWRDMHNLRHSDPVFGDAAEKYEGGMLAFSALDGLRASLELLVAVGDTAVEERVLHLARLCGGDGSTPIVTLDTGGRSATELVSELKAQRILVTSRFGRLRVSAHYYNDEADVERLLAALRG